MRLDLSVCLMLCCGEMAAAQNATDEGVPSLWTRNRERRWRAFLGPRGDGKSAETGLVRAEGGPKLL